VLSLDGDRKARPLIQTPFDESAAMFSPDGRWISYQSDESGQNEVYVQSFPGPGGKWQVSTEGGSLAVWARDMTELFYRQGDKVMAVKVKLKPSFSATKPRVVFEGRYGGGSFPDIAPDGRSFAMVQLGEVEKAPTQIQVVLGAMEVLRLGATGRK
jgi:hypothetical protein